MGIDNDTPTTHENITFNEPVFRSTHFYGEDSQVYLTLTHDGRLVLGPGISKQKATQEIAAMLVREYHKLTGVEII